MDPLTVLSAAAFLAVVLSSGGVFAQAELETTAVDSITADMDSTATVVLAGQDLFELGSQSVESADERAAALSGAILEVAKSRRISTEDLRLIRDERIQATLIMGGRLFLGAVWDYEAANLGVTTEDLAAERLDIIRQAITEYRSDFSAQSLIRGAIFGGLAVVGGCFLMIRDRFIEDEGAGRSTWFDWSLLWLIMFVALSGFAVEALHYMRLEPHRHAAYYVHLLLILTLFLYLPYSKLAHAVYRFVALVFIEWTGRRES